MAQSLWHRKDLERIAQVLIAVAPCAEYAEAWLHCALLSAAK